MRIKYLIILLCSLSFNSFAEFSFDRTNFPLKRKVGTVAVSNIFKVKWQVNKTDFGELTFNMDKNAPLLKSIKIFKNKSVKVIARNLDPVFLLNIGKRTLDTNQGGWNVFFDRVPKKPYKSVRVQLDKSHYDIVKNGHKTLIKISKLHADIFSGDLEVTLYDGSFLFNIAAVVSTELDSTAILYDAGLVSKSKVWDNIAWSDTENKINISESILTDTSKNVMSKYRMIIGEKNGSSLGLFPSPHQYFYPLDEAFNLSFNWYGNGYRNMVDGYGIGIRQDPFGDKRYVPWFNSPPRTKQRLNFFCLPSIGKANLTLEKIKKYTRSDSYAKLDGFKTMQSHFHNEYISNVVLKKLPILEEPNFIKVFKNTGVNIVHLAEFHGKGHPKGPDSLRLNELNQLFYHSERLSSKDLLVLPGEEANNFFGGHWLAFFPKPVYWVMSRKSDQPFITKNSQYGNVYYVSNKDEMLKLLELEKGLAWTAHARTKSSTFFPDTYKNENFFKSDRFLGAAWKAIPADLSWDRLSRRVLDLMDDMNNWGLRKHVIGEADLFTIEPENEMYAHLNVNYLKLNHLPKFKDGWQEILDVIENGDFFTTTGEVLIPIFTLDGQGPGKTIKFNKQVKLNVGIHWTFPLNYVEIVSGDGMNVFRQKININQYKEYGHKLFSLKPKVMNNNISWMRLEAWDIATNGAFTQTIWFKK